jgi:multidrug efflux pump
VVNGVENTKQAAWMNKTPAVILNIQRQPGANTITVVNSIQKILPQLGSESARVDQGHDADRHDHQHSASVHDVEFELMLTIGLVVMVIFLFLRSLTPPSFPAWPCRFRWSAPLP